MTTILFLIDLVWDLKEEKATTTKGEDEVDLEKEEKMEITQVSSDLSSSQTRLDLIVTACTSLVRVIDELNLFNVVDDQSASGLFKNWAASFIKKTLSSKFK